MTLREDLNACTPRLRRYARALATGSASPSAASDDLVHAALMRALEARDVGSKTELMIRLYAILTQMHRDQSAGRDGGYDAPSASPPIAVGPLAPALERQSRLSMALLDLSLEEREALLLVALEGFDHATAARILRISQAVLLARLTRAREALDGQLATAPLPGPSRRQVPYLRLVT